MEKVLVHYGEIALKGKNRPMFENLLVENIKKSANFQKVKLKSIGKQRGFILCEFDEVREKIIHVLKAVLGVTYFCFIDEVDAKVNIIVDKVSKMLEQIKDQGHTTISFKTKRADKKFPLTSPELNAKFGEVSKDLGLKVDYSNAPVKIYVEINTKKCFIYSKRIEGYGGLPVGSSGKVLCLLSGGIDSPVAAWQMIKRGCTVDFVHVHNMKSESDVEKSKMKEIINVLSAYQFRSKMHLIPYHVYEFGTMEKVPRQYDLVLFKHYLLKVAEAIAKKEKYKAVVTGDNLAQVASQTLDNLKAVSYGLELPIFRPLLTYDKNDIVRVAEQIGTYKPSIKQYKDCCSILAKHPQLNTKVEVFKELIEKINVDKLVDESIKVSKVL